MDADFSIELGREDPVLDFPWTDPAGKLAYFDLKRQPALIAKVEEAEQFPELAEFLRTVNSALSLVESAKCDVWTTAELSAEEEIFNASHKFASYVDLVFSDVGQPVLAASRKLCSEADGIAAACAGDRRGGRSLRAAVFFRRCGRNPRGVLSHCVCERLRRRRIGIAEELGDWNDVSEERDHSALYAARIISLELSSRQPRFLLPAVVPPVST